MFRDGDRDEISLIKECLRKEDSGDRAAGDDGAGDGVRGALELPGSGNGIRLTLGSGAWTWTCD